MSEAFCKNAMHKARTLVTCVGLQPGSSVWVFGPDVQINKEGHLIQKDEQPYYWLVSQPCTTTYNTCRCSQYAPIPDIQCYLTPAMIFLPLRLQPLQDLIRVMREYLGNNFLSGFATIAASIIIFHYQSVLNQQDECPLILCYSHSNGTGMIIFMNNQ